jgi:branched-subunit amino acid transport protein
MNLWPVLILGGLLTFAIRLSFILLFGRVELPEWTRRSLRFVPPAILSAIIVPELVFHAGKIDLSFNNFRLLAGIFAIIVALRTRNTLLTILLGMAALLALQALFGMR